MVKFEHLPLDNISINSSYGPRNSTVNNISYWWHNGVDLYAVSNTPIYAVTDGTVMAVKHDNGGYGIYISIDHEKFGTLYAHLSSSTAQEGKKVKAGELIGYTGNTGNTTGPHLHFELRICKYKDFWDRADCDRSVFMQTSDPIFYIEECQERLKDLTVEAASEIVKTKAGLEDKTMDYIVNDYKYGHDLVIKLAKALL